MAVIPRGGTAELSRPVRDSNHTGHQASRPYRADFGHAYPVARRVHLWSGTIENGIIFSLSTAVNLTVACLLIARLGIIRREAMWQTVSAWLALSSGTFRPLASNPILPPLPTLLQLPLAWWPALREAGLSSALVTALAGGLTCAMLNLVFRHWDLGRLWRIPLIALFALNPMILYYSDSGAAEMISVLFIVSSAYCFLVWQDLEGSSSPLALIALAGLGFTTGLACLTRYDVVFYAAILAGLIWLQTRNRLSTPSGRSQAVLITFLAPVAFCIGAWILFMLLAGHESSVLAQGGIAGAAQPGQSPGLPESLAVPPPLGDLLAAWVWEVFPLFPVGVGLLICDYALHRHTPSCSLAVLALCFPTVQTLSELLGFDQVLGSPQAPVLAVPFAFIIAGMLLSRLSSLTSPEAATGYHHGWEDTALTSLTAHDSSFNQAGDQGSSTRERSRRRWGGPLALLGLTLSTVISGVMMAERSEPCRWENSLPQCGVAALATDSWRDEREIAHFLVEHAGEHRVLVNELEAYPVIFFTGHPEIFVTAGELDLHSEVLSPFGQVEYVLGRLPPRSSATSNSVNWPNLVLDGILQSRTAEVSIWPDSGWRLGRIAEQYIDGEVVH